MSFGQPPPLSELCGRAERDRLRAVYAGYETRYHHRIWHDNSAVPYMVNRKWTLIRSLLADGPVHAEAATVVDLGAGDGDDCARFRELGVPAHRILAVDILEQFTRRARKSHPWLTVIQAGGWRLPFADASIDILLQSTMLSSVVDRHRRRTIYAEIRRVLTPGGIFLSYDVRYPNPSNRSTRPIRPAEFRAGFPGWSVTLHSITGIPALLRAVARCSLVACRLIESIPVLRSHLMMSARRPPA